MIINPNQVASSKALDLLAARQIETQYGPADEFLFRYANQDVVALALGSVAVRQGPGSGAQFVLQCPLPRQSRM